MVLIPFAGASGIIGIAVVDLLKTTDPFSKHCQHSGGSGAVPSFTQEPWGVGLACQGNQFAVHIGKIFELSIAQIFGNGIHFLLRGHGAVGLSGDRVVDPLVPHCIAIQNTQPESFSHNIAVGRGFPQFRSDGACGA